jgi:polyhydroxyalkanoate synthesis repressor PhaR
MLNMRLLCQKKNRRLYNTQTSCYVTLEDLGALIKLDQDIKVVDAKTGDDLTRITLTQVVLDREQKGYELLPEEMLKQLIKFYNHPLSNLFTDYMRESMKYFNGNFGNMTSMMEGFQLFDPQNFYKEFKDMAEKHQEFFPSFFKPGDKNNKK